jgi:hypothetical protein
MRRAAWAVLACLAISPAAAAPAAGAVTPPQPPATVSSLTIYPKTDPPKIVSSFPAQGQTLAPGVTVIRITFDQPMRPDFDISAAPGGVMPDCLKTPRLLNDGKSFVLLCTTAPKTAYTVAINAHGKAGFETPGQVRAAPAALSFATNNDDGPRNLAEAMKVAKLGDLDSPIERSEFPARTAAAPPP